MIRTSFIAAVVLFGCWIGPAQAEDVTVGSLKISSSWARATPKGASVGGAYMTITNTGVVWLTALSGAPRMSPAVSRSTR